MVYFDIIGIAWPIRVMLHLRDIDYELIQVSIHQWAQGDAEGNRLLKPCCKIKHGDLIHADKHGFLAGTGSERTSALEVMGQAYDALFHWNGMFPVNIRLGMSDNEATKRLDAFMGEGVYGLSTDGYRQNLDAFERYLAKSDGDYFVGQSLTAADLQSFNALRNWYKAFAPDVFMDEYPKLNKFVQRIEVLPQINDYIAHHQEPTTWFNWPEAALRLTSAAELDAIKV